MAEFYGNQPTSQLYVMLTKLNPSFSDEKLGGTDFNPNTLRHGFMQINRFPEDPQFEHGFPINPVGRKTSIPGLPFSLAFPAPPIPDEFEDPDFTPGSLTSTSTSTTTLEGETDTDTLDGPGTDTEGTDGEETETDTLTSDSDDWDDDPDYSSETTWMREYGCKGCNTPLELHYDDSDVMIGDPWWRTVDSSSGQIVEPLRCSAEQIANDTCPFEFREDDFYRYSPTRFANRVFTNLRCLYTVKVSVDLVMRPPKHLVDKVYEEHANGNAQNLNNSEWTIESFSISGDLHSSLMTAHLPSFINTQGLDPDCLCDISSEQQSTDLGKMLITQGGWDGPNTVGKRPVFDGAIRTEIESKLVTMEDNLVPGDCLFGAHRSSFNEWCPDVDWDGFKHCKWRGPGHVLPVLNILKDDDGNEGWTPEFLKQKITSGFNTNVGTEWPFGRMYETKDSFDSIVEQLRRTLFGDAPAGIAPFASNSPYNCNNGSSDQCTSRNWCVSDIFEDINFWRGRTTGAWAMPSLGGGGSLLLGQPYYYNTTLHGQDPTAVWYCNGTGNDQNGNPAPETRQNANIGNNFYLSDDECEDVIDDPFATSCKQDNPDYPDCVSVTCPNVGDPTYDPNTCSGCDLYLKYWETHSADTGITPEVTWPQHKHDCPSTWNTDGIGCIQNGWCWWDASNGLIDFLDTNLLPDPGSCVTCWQSENFPASMYMQDVAVFGANNPDAPSQQDNVIGATKLYLKLNGTFRHWPAISYRDEGACLRVDPNNPTGDKLSGVLDWIEVKAHVGENSPPGNNAGGGMWLEWEREWQDGNPGETPFEEANKTVFFSGSRYLWMPDITLFPTGYSPIAENCDCTIYHEHVPDICQEVWGGGFTTTAEGVGFIDNDYDDGAWSDAGNNPGLPGSFNYGLPILRGPNWLNKEILGTNHPYVGGPNYNGNQSSSPKDSLDISCCCTNDMTHTRTSATPVDFWARCQNKVFEASETVTEVTGLLDSNDLKEWFWQVTQSNINAGVHYDGADSAQTSIGGYFAPEWWSNVITVWKVKIPPLNDGEPATEHYYEFGGKKPNGENALSEFYPEIDLVVSYKILQNEVIPTAGSQTVWDGP